MPPNAWTVVWPGLSRLWLRGQWRGLALAMGFAAALNGLLVATFLWPRLIGTDSWSVVFSALGWPALLCFWGASVWNTWRLLPRLQPGADAHGDDALFLRAQTEYLRGHWYEAEKLLVRLLADSPRDADAHLLLASLFRHTRRYEEAQRQWDLLERLDNGARWLFEIDEERRRLADLIEQGSNEESHEDDTASKAA